MRSVACPVTKAIPLLNIQVTAHALNQTKADKRNWKMKSVQLSKLLLNGKRELQRIHIFYQRLSRLLVYTLPRLQQQGHHTASCPNAKDLRHTLGLIRSHHLPHLQQHLFSGPEQSRKGLECLRLAHQHNDHNLSGTASAH